MQRYRYKAITVQGRQVQGVISAVNENDLYKQLAANNLELVRCKRLSDGRRGRLALSKVKIRELIQLFVSLEQMQRAGVSLLDALSDIRDSSDRGRLRDILTDVQRDVIEGSSLSEAMARHPAAFNDLILSLIKAGEETGNITDAYRELVAYLKWIDNMQRKIRKATRYPMIVMAVVVLAIVVMMGYVVPQIVAFVKTLNQELPFYTIALIATSEFFQKYWWVVLGIPIILFVLCRILMKASAGFAYAVDAAILRVPVVGGVIKKIAIARYAQTFGALFSSGIDVINALKAARKTAGNRVLNRSLENVEEAVQSGATLSQAFARSGDFPSMVTRMLKIGEESGNLGAVLDQISEFYTKDVDESIETMIAMIEPGLTAVMGLMILWIAAGVFGPIYSSFEHIEF